MYKPNTQIKINNIKHKTRNDYVFFPDLFLRAVSMLFTKIEINSLYSVIALSSFVMSLTSGFLLYFKWS